MLWEGQSNDQAQMKIKPGRFENRILEMTITEINTGCTVHQTADSVNLKMSEVLLHDSLSKTKRGKIGNSFWKVIARGKAFQILPNTKSTEPGEQCFSVGREITGLR